MDFGICKPVKLYGLAADPVEVYRTLRERHGPVVPVLLDGDVPAWLVLGYREVCRVAGDARTFARDCRRWNAWDRVPEDWPLMPHVGWTPSVVFAEGAEHRRRSGALGEALDGVRRPEMALACRRIADGLIDGFAADGRADLVDGYARPMSLLAVAWLLGLPEEDVPELAEEADAARNVTGAVDSCKDAHRRMHARMQRLVGERRYRARDDVPSRLLAHPAGLTDEEAALDLLALLVSAHRPTADWIASALRVVLAGGAFGGEPRGDGDALREALWEDTPVQGVIGRWAVHDCVLGDRRIHRGDLLVLGLGAANADPHAQPDGAAPNRAHLSFGHGEHGCPPPAPELAEVVARAAVAALPDRLADVRLAVPAADLEWRPSPWTRGPAALPVEFTPEC
ncbi:cytochrome P450 [Actinomadura kijaniata]